MSSLAIAFGQFIVGLPGTGDACFQIRASSLILSATSVAYFFGPRCQDLSPAVDPLLKCDDLILTQCRHHQRIVGLACLFAVDSFAGGMIMNAVLIHWMVLKFSMSEHMLGMLFAASSVITTPSLWVAAWLGNRIGLINTMVFTHIPSNLVCCALPILPNMESVSLAVLVRGLLSQMDVPARDAFMASVVDPEERVACNSFIASARGMACIAGPPAAALLWATCGPGSPLVVAGILKCMYDLTLFFTFRAVHAPTPKEQDPT